MSPYATSTRSKKVFQYARSVKKQQNRAADLLKKTYRLLVRILKTSNPRCQMSLVFLI